MELSTENHSLETLKKRLFKTEASTAVSPENTTLLTKLNPLSKKSWKPLKKSNRFITTFSDRFRTTSSDQSKITFNDHISTFETIQIGTTLYWLCLRWKIKMIWSRL